MSMQWDSEPQFQQMMLEQQLEIERAERAEHRSYRTFFDLLRRLVVGRWPIDYLAVISATFPLVINARRRKYFYLWSSVALTLSAALTGADSIAVPAQHWTLLALPHNYLIFAQGQQAPTYVRIHETDNALPVQKIQGAFAEFTGSTSTQGNVVVGPIDVSAYRWMTFRTSGTWSGIIAFQGSMVGGTNAADWDNIALEVPDGSNTGISPSITIDHNQLLSGPVVSHYVRFIANTLSSGTVNGTLDLWAEPAANWMTVGFTSLNGGVNLIGFTDNDGFHATAIPAGTVADTAVAAGNGHMLGGILVTATGTNPLQVFDNSVSSGLQMGALPASPALGMYPHHTWSTTGNILVKGNAANPAVTIYWS